MSRMRGTFMRPDGSTFSTVGYAEASQHSTRYVSEGAAWAALGDRLAADTKDETDTPGYYFTTLGVQFNDDPWTWRMAS